MLFLVALVALEQTASMSQFELNQATIGMYAACLYRENDRRRAAGPADLNDFGSSCGEERLAILRLYEGWGEASNSDTAAARLKGVDDTFRANIDLMNRVYPPPE
jgi:hypothetical protein